MHPAKLTLECDHAFLKDSGEENLTSQDMPPLPLPLTMRVLRGKALLNYSRSDGSGSVIFTVVYLSPSA